LAAWALSRAPRGERERKATPQEAFARVESAVLRVEGDRLKAMLVQFEGALGAAKEVPKSRRARIVTLIRHQAKT
jgi:hypothetical protein